MPNTICARLVDVWRESAHIIRTGSHIGIYSFYTPQNCTRLPREIHGFRRRHSGPIQTVLRGKAKEIYATIEIIMELSIGGVTLPWKTTLSLSSISKYISQRHIAVCGCGGGSTPSRLSGCDDACRFRKYVNTHYKTTWTLLVIKWHQATTIVAYI